jgi:hypothetical protein
MFVSLQTCLAGIAPLVESVTWLNLTFEKNKTGPLLLHKACVVSILLAT